MVKDRRHQLLNGIANQLESGDRPMGGKFLLDYQVSFDELTDLEQIVIQVLRGFSNLPAEDQKRVLLASAAESPAEAELILSGMEELEANQTV